MAANAGILMGRTRPIPGRESDARETFQQSLSYCAKLQAEGKIDGFEPALVSGMRALRWLAFGAGPVDLARENAAR